MVNKVLILAILGLTTVSVVNVTEGLNCYKCSSCTDEFKNTPSTKCTKDDLENSGTTTVTTTKDTTVTTTKDTTVTTTEGTIVARINDANIADPSSTTGSSISTDPSSTTNTPITDFSCYTIQDGDKIDRGCTKKVDNCDAIKDLIGEKECKKICIIDDCNPATNIQSFAFITIIFIAIVKMLLH